MKRIVGALPLKGMGWLVVLLLFTACRDEFNLDKLQNASKMVLYCFPTTADTTYISVTTSVGVKRTTDTRQTQPLDDARISYTVNGEAREVQQAGDGMFFVVGRQQPGDRIGIRAEHSAYGVAEATATVPEAVPVTMERVVAIKEYDPDWYEARDFYQLQATFTDPATTEDYYGVRVCVKKYKGHGSAYYEGTEGEEGGVSIYVGDYDTYQQFMKMYPDYHWSYELTDSIVEWPQVVTIDEPLLNPLSGIDSDFGFDNESYDNFYIFSDREISGQTYTLRLNIPTYTGRGEYDWGEERYQVVLYRITPDFYQFLKSYNDVANNELAQGGFSQVSPTRSNVSGGFGLLGSYAAWKSNWKKEEK